jgi:alkanesulfonate monooxygenase SsuD/methylene tetrahydromethanopterin reductase-like flavin-dependent oxidoreductase (luciferase family)
MPLEFGVFDHIEHQDGVPLETLYSQRLEQVRLLDDSDFYLYHVAEHHTPTIHSMAPAQNVFLAAAAQHTERIRLGGGVYTLPFHHPIRLLEELCMLDHLSHGRLEIGVGRGGGYAGPNAVLIEAYYWGMGSSLDPQGVDAEVRGRYDESLALLFSGFTQSRINHTGKYYRFVDLPIVMHPLQQPYPPFWYMRNLETAARDGMNVVTTGGLKQLAKDVVHFRELWDHEQGPGYVTPQGSAPKIGAFVFVVVAPTDEEAEAIGASAWKQFSLNLFAPRWQQAQRAGLTQLWNHGNGQDARPTSPNPTEKDAISLVAGSPQTVHAYFEAYEKTGANYVHLNLQFGDITHETAMQSVRLLAGEVLPHFRPVLVGHRT